MMEQLQAAARQLADANELKTAIGRVLTEEQQIAVTARIEGDKRAFFRWLDTDAGREATRAYVTAFLK